MSELVPRSRPSPPTAWASPGTPPGGRILPALFLGLLMVLSAFGAGAFPTASHLGTAHVASPAGGSLIHPAAAATLTLNPASGVIGTTVHASGTGFLANGTIQFTVAGQLAPSNCAADPLGDFPGTSGTACTFVVPVHPGGAITVTASGGWTVTKTIGVGSTPSNIAYDPQAGKLFVSSDASNNLTVINDTSDTTVGSIALPGSPIALAFDPTNNEVFVADSTTTPGLVSVVNASTNRLVANVTVGSRPVSAAYDSGRGEVFVTNSQSDNVSVIDASTLAVVGNVSVGYWPTGLVYVRPLGEVFVDNSFGNSVSVIADSNNSVVATVPVGNNPYNPEYDPALAEVLVVNHQDGTLSVISTATNSVTATVAVGTGPVNLAYVPSAGLSFVTNSGSGNLSVFDDASELTVQSIPLPGDGPNGILYDRGNGGVYVVNTFVDNVVELTSSVVANSTFTVDANLTAPGAVEVGATVDLTGDGFGSGAAISHLALGSAALHCLGASTGTCTQGALSADPTGAFDATFLVPSVPVGGAMNWSAVDALGNGANASVVVTLDPVAATPSATPPSAALGESVTFVTSATLGSGGYAYQWSGLPSGCASNDQPTLTCTPQRAGTYQVVVTVTDSAGFSGTSPALTFIVGAVYPLVFHETGLPTGTTWAVVVGSSTASSSGSNVSFVESNGSYTYLVLPVTGYVVSTSGLATVNGSVTIVHVVFALQKFPVVFVVIGLPVGSNWSVNVSNATTGFHLVASSTASSIVVFLANGTYTITFSFPGNFSANLTATAITVAGHATGASIGGRTGGVVTSPPTPAAGFFTPFVTAILGVLLGVVAGVLVVLALGRRRPPAPEPPPAPVRAGPARGRAAPVAAEAPADPAADPLDEVF